MGPEYFPFTPISPHLIPYSPTKATRWRDFGMGCSTTFGWDGPALWRQADETDCLSRKRAQEGGVDVVFAGVNFEGRSG